MKPNPTTHTAKGVDKTARYGWVTKDQPGELKMLHKDVLSIEDEYQRDVLNQKVSDITSGWSWIAFGALVVAERDGKIWVIDGQHRLIAAQRRSDITYLPCVVFKTTSLKTEAQGFLDLNTGRKPVTAIGKQKALVTAGDETAIYVHQQLAALGLEIKATATTAGQLKCVAWCTSRANENKDAFRRVLAMGAELSQKDNIPVAEKLLEGLWVLNAKCGEGLADKRLIKRLHEKGARLLLEAANRASAYYVSGGSKVWAQGMLAELNKGMRNKFTMDGAEG